MNQKETKEKLNLGISACLLGQEVRFDGGHKKDQFCVNTMGKFADWTPVCPEVEMGLPTPRETMQLVQLNGGPIELMTGKTRQNLTDGMKNYSIKRAAEIVEQNLDGYVFMKNSPSCGLHRVRVYDHNHVPHKTGRGLFAEALTQLDPALPVEEEGRLNDSELRNAFLIKIFTHYRMRKFFESDWTVGDLHRFHANEKLLLLSCHPNTYRELGRYVASYRGDDRNEFYKNYRLMLMQGLDHRATIGRHVNVMQHIMSYFKRKWTQPIKDLVMNTIKEFEQKAYPLIVPLTMLKHYTELYEVDYLKSQSYFAPGPLKLLRYHAIPNRV